MSLSNDEFAMLERGRQDLEMRRANARELVDLAYRHLVDLYGQQRKLLKTMDTMQLIMQRQQRSLCYRVPAFVALRWARVKRYFGRG